MSHTATTNETLNTLYARHSIRSYQPYEMPEADLHELLKAAGAAPSAWNLQHWKFLIVDSADDKAKLSPIAYNQKQITECSVNVVVLGDLEANKNAQLVYGPAIESGYVPAEVGQRIIDSIEQAYARKELTVARDHAFLNASLASMNLMLAAEAMGYKSVPASGFDPVKLVEEFKVPERYVPVMIVSIGKSDEVSRGSGRFPVEATILRP